MMGLLSNLHRLPSIQNITTDIVDALADGCSVLVLLPGGVSPADVWRRVRSDLGGRGFDHLPPRLIAAANMAPVDQLSTHYGLSQDDMPSLQNLIDGVEARHRPGVVFTVADVDTLPEAAIQSWMQLLTDLAILAQRRSAQDRPTSRVCIIAAADRVLPYVPTSNTLLKIFWWAGFPSILEHQLLCRISDDPFADSASKLWYEHILPEIAGTDSALLELLMQSASQSPEDITALPTLIPHLSNYAQQRQWTAVAADQFSLPARSGFQFADGDVNRLTGSERSGWARGVLGCTPEQGWHVHSALLAFHGREEDLKRRIWRGQSRLLLPIVDQVRLDCCQYLTNRHGDWAPRWVNPQHNPHRTTAAVSPFEVELGELKHLFKTCGEVSQEASIWRGLINQAWVLRNEIAHYKPVTLDAFRQLWALRDNQTRS